MNLGMLFRRHARYRPDHTAVVFGDQRLTYFQLNQNINKLANAMLSLGIRKGSAVATVLPNCLELFETYWASAKVGAVVVPMSTLLMEGALRSLLEDADAEWLSPMPHLQMLSERYNLTCPIFVLDAACW